MNQDTQRAPDAVPGAAAQPPDETRKKGDGAAGRTPAAAPGTRAGSAAAKASGEPAAAKAPAVAASKAARPAAPGARRGGTVIAAVSLLLSLAALGAGAYFWQQYDQRQQQLDARIAAAQQGADRANQSAGALGDTVSGLQRQVGTLGDSLQSTAAQLTSKVDGAVGDMQATDRALQESVQKVHDELQRSSDDWIAAEAEYLIRVASQRLQLTGDARTAMRALEDADRRLRDMGDPSLLEVRKKIADDIVALRAVSQPDLTGMSLTLTGLSNHVADLPLAGAQPVSATLTAQEGAAAPTDTAGGWRQYLRRLWAGLRQLVVIRHSGETGKPILTPDERVILRQNLRLQLEAARVALLRGDEQLFRDTLGSADKWLGEYFDTGSQPVSSMRQTLQQLQATALTPQLPDLSADLKALRAWEDKHTGKAAGGDGPSAKAAS